ncbi:MAG: DNA polymerase III subunit beta [Planctomycetes bacterium]|nr:DNA polymerase III subunit beta [Planctomycetota bacterium]
MKVSVKTAALQDALAVAGSIVASRSPKPVLQCVKLIASENVLTLVTTDLEAGCRYTITEVVIEEPGEALIPAGSLTGIVRELGDEESLTIETEKDACHVRGSSSHFKMFTFDPAEYPPVAELTDEPDLVIGANQLSSMISKTLFATAKADSHYAISGVLWEASGKKLQLVATDGHRLAQAKGSLAETARGDVAAIVPTKLMSLIERVCGQDNDKFEVKVQETQVIIRSPRAILVSSLVQGNFPKYADVIPKNCSRKAVINRDRFGHSIRLAALLANEESRGIRVSLEAEKAVLSSRAPESGEAEVTCPIEYDGEAIQIAFSPQLLLDAIRVIETDELTLELNAPDKPAMIRSGSDFLYVIMPVDLG